MIREALAAYVPERTAPVRDEAEHALQVLGRLGADRGPNRAAA